MRRALRLWGPPVLYMMLIFHFSSESNPMPVVTEHIWDKVLHLSEYAGLAVLFGRALAAEGFSFGSTGLLAALLTSAYGATDEYHQWFVPMRTSDLHDWIADTTGGAIGAVCYTAARLYFTGINVASASPSRVFGRALCCEPRARGTIVTSADTARGRIRVKKVPPSDFLEGIDLRPYHFVAGHVYTVSQDVATVLLLWDYAESAPARSSLTPLAD
jgi:VanZ family protein